MAKSEATFSLDLKSVSTLNDSMATQSINLISSSHQDTLYLNDVETTVYFNDSSTVPFDNSVSYGLGTTVTVAIVLGSVAFLAVVVIVIVCFMRWRIQKKKVRAFVDNLTLSYIADSNIDLTKDNYDEMISLDNDNFLNSLVDASAFSRYSSHSSTRHYSYSYF